MRSLLYLLALPSWLYILSSWRSTRLSRYYSKPTLEEWYRVRGESMWCFDVFAWTFVVIFIMGVSDLIFIGVYR